MIIGTEIILDGLKLFKLQLTVDEMPATPVEKNGKYPYRYSGNMTVEAILPYLPKGFYILEQVETDPKGNVSEVSYYISNPNHERSSYWFENINYDDGSKRFIRNRIYNL